MIRSSLPSRRPKRVVAISIANSISYGAIDSFRGRGKRSREELSANRPANQPRHATRGIHAARLFVCSNLRCRATFFARRPYLQPAVAGAVITKHIIAIAVPRMRLFGRFFHFVVQTFSLHVQVE